MSEKPVKKKLIKLDLGAATEAEVNEPTVENLPLSGKEKAGVNLTWGVLGIISVFLILVFIVISMGADPKLLAEDFKTLLGVTDITGLTLADYVKEIELQRESRREFILEIVDTVLINVLLPVLTALLGYIFGTTSQALSNGSNEE